MVRNSSPDGRSAAIDGTPGPPLGHARGDVERSTGADEWGGIVRLVLGEREPVPTGVTRRHPEGRLTFGRSSREGNLGGHPEAMPVLHTDVPLGAEEASYPGAFLADQVWGDVSLQEALPILGEGGDVPDGVIHVDPHEPAEEEVVV